MILTAKLNNIKSLTDKGQIAKETEALKTLVSSKIPESIKKLPKPQFKFFAYLILGEICLKHGFKDIALMLIEKEPATVSSSSEKLKMLIKAEGWNQCKELIHEEYQKKGDLVK